ncbi:MULTISPECIES: Z1 domain-containing protein [Novosphingobium]|uniref:Z1 domain-containing protein n=1 Tax=Novosphingobium TaxID=165696 RepID=UPI0035B35220
MTVSQEAAHLNIIKLVQMMLGQTASDQVITPEIIDQNLTKAIDLLPVIMPGLDVTIDRAFLLSELIRRSSQAIGKNTTLKSDAGHLDWLNAERKKDWRYWRRYAMWLEAKMPPQAIDALDEATDDVLRQLEAPDRPGAWDRRGLVVGHVQSGKTGNYTGLICKAADAGYKIIIVLAGLHNNLRAQTQLRLDEGFLGFATIPNVDEKPIIGVGEIDSDRDIRPNFATNRSEKGDFDTRASKTLGVTPEERPWLFVVKKNKTVLERLLYWIQNHAWDAHESETGRKLVTKLPLLVIDDESDHGSVDTGEQIMDGNGQPDPEYEPKTINRLIRSVLHSFTRKAYVGYTATPFANIFIHEQGETREHGPDLFPSAFIVNLAAPSNYVGPAKVFGHGDSDIGDLPLIRELREDEYAGWMKPGHRNGYVPTIDGERVLPPSLEEAIRSFVLACAVRKLRGQHKKHSSMLVHVTRFTSVQNEVKLQVENYVRQMRQRFMRNMDLKELEETFQHQWNAEFRPACDEIRNSFPEIVSAEDPDWRELRQAIPDVLSDISVRQINGSAKDALDYFDNEATGLKVIAIGGDKLARGLTLEGLCTSYFLRTAKMYDTLMQMGRWFGYRDGYLDLCRLYTTGEIVDWFGHIAEASEKMRSEFDHMAAVGDTPRQYGLKVQSHSVMTVTSPAKMRSAKTLLLSFSGDMLQTIVFPNKPSEIQSNFDAGVRLVAAMGQPVPLSEQRRVVEGQSWSGHLWRDVPHTLISGFLRDYQTHKQSMRVVAPVIAQFIDAMAQSGELTDWTVAIVSKEDDGSPENTAEIAGLPVCMLTRRRARLHDDRYSIKILTSPRDEFIDVSPAQWNEALAKTRDRWTADAGRNQSAELPEEPSGPVLREVRGFGENAEPQKGLLLLYLINPKESGLPEIETAAPVLAWAVSFPGSNSGTKVPYEVNNVLWTQINGWAD